MSRLIVAGSFSAALLASGCAATITPHGIDLAPVVARNYPPVYRPLPFCSPYHPYVVQCVRR